MSNDSESNWNDIRFNDQNVEWKKDMRTEANEKNLIDVFFHDFFFVQMVMLNA